MKHIVNALAGRLHRRQVSDGPDVQINLVAHSRQVRFLAARKIIQHHYFLAATNQLIHNIRADESGAAGHEISHSENPPGENARDKWPVIYLSGTLDYIPAACARATSGTRMDGCCAMRWIRKGCRATQE